MIPNASSVPRYLAHRRLWSCRSPSISGVWLFRRMQGTPPSHSALTPAIGVTRRLLTLRTASAARLGQGRLRRHSRPSLARLTSRSPRGSRTGRPAIGPARLVLLGSESRPTVIALTLMMPHSLSWRSARRAERTCQQRCRRSSARGGRLGLSARNLASAHSLSRAFRRMTAPVNGPRRRRGGRGGLRGCRRSAAAQRFRKRHRDRRN